MINKETMYDCYRSQFQCLHRIFQSKEALLKDFTECYVRQRPDRLVLVGSGTSYHACHAAVPYLESCLGIEVNVKAPTALGVIYGERPLAIAVSQSGRSTNTVEAVKSLKAKGIPVITLTDPTDTAVGREGDLAVLLAAENEKIGPKTRGYTATMFILHLMALAAGMQSGQLDSFSYESGLSDLQSLIESGDGYLEACGLFFERHSDDLKKAGHYLFVGKGVSARAAEESALKVLETLCCPAAGYEFEEFLHGPAFCANETLALFLFISDDTDAQRMLDAAGLISRATEKLYLISHVPRGEHGDNLHSEKILYLPCKKHLAAFVDVLFPQLIAAKLPEMLGRSRHRAVSNMAGEMGTKL